MKDLSIDIETFSETNIGKSGLYKYAADASFMVLLFAYKEDDRPTQIIDLAMGQTVPQRVVDALADPDVRKHAFNAQFERVCLSHWLGLPEPLDPEGWYCTMVHAGYAGLPMSLDACGKALGLEQQKMREGRNLIKQFCTPNPKNLLTEGGRNLPESDPEAWRTFKKYCVRDVDVEHEISMKLSDRVPPASEWELYWLDQRINDCGVRIDTQFATNARDIGERYKQECESEARELTGLDNPNSVTQLSDWLEANDCPVESLSKQNVAQAVKTTSSPGARRVLELRQEMSRSSTRKYDTMLNCETRGRAHGLIQFYGANRTGRWAGRLIQVQNLPRNYMSDLDEARTLVKQGDMSMFKLLYPVPDTLSQLIRTAFIPSEGNVLAVCDFSAIEARVLAWLAGETSTLQSFRDGKDLYCETASRMFGVPVVKHGINGELRQKGKIATLACGYGGSVGALKAMGALNMGLSEDELQPVVDAWRNANQRIVSMWWDIDKAAKEAIQHRRTSRLYHVKIGYAKNMLIIRLPSGRALFYPGARIEKNRWGNTGITHLGVNTVKKWACIQTYGPKLVENIVQAVARDLLANALTNLDHAGYQTVMHIHDEAVIDTTPDRADIDEISRIMCRLPAWAKGLPLTADGYTCSYYQKD